MHQCAGVVWHGQKHWPRLSSSSAVQGHIVFLMVAFNCSSRERSTVHILISRCYDLWIFLSLILPPLCPTLGWWHDSNMLGDWQMVRIWQPQMAKFWSFKHGYHHQTHWVNAALSLLSALTVSRQTPSAWEIVGRIHLRFQLFNNQTALEVRLPLLWANTHPKIHLGHMQCDVIWTVSVAKWDLDPSMVHSEESNLWLNYLQQHDRVLWLAALAGDQISATTTTVNMCPAALTGNMNTQRKHQAWESEQHPSPLAWEWQHCHHSGLTLMHWLQGFSTSSSGKSACFLRDCQNISQTSQLLCMLPLRVKGLHLASSSSDPLCTNPPPCPLPGSGQTCDWGMQIGSCLLKSKKYLNVLTLSLCALLAQWPSKTQPVTIYGRVLVRWPNMFPYKTWQHHAEILCHCVLCSCIHHSAQCAGALKTCCKSNLQGPQCGKSIHRSS